MSSSGIEGIIAIGIPIVFGIFVVIIVAILSGQMTAKRNAEMQALANQYGFEFYPEGMKVADYEASLNSLFGFGGPSVTCPHPAEFVPFFDMFDRGHSRYLRPAIVGNDHRGFKWFLFDYRYTTGSGKNQATHSHSVIIVKTNLLLPTMSMTKEHFLNTVGKMLGAHELQVESEEFNRRYYIKTSDSKMSLDLLHPQMIEAMLVQEHMEWFTSGVFIMIPVYGKASPAEFARRKPYIDEFLSLVPTYYQQDHQTSVPPTWNL